MFQTPSCLPLPADTVEGRLQRELEIRLAESVGAQFGRNIAGILTRMLVAGVWDAEGEAMGDEAKMLARAGRRVSINRRGQLARIIAAADAKTGAEGVKRMRQAVSSAPAALNFVPDEELVDRVTQGESIMTIMLDHGATKDITKLSKSAAALITEDNIERACLALGGVNPNVLPTGRKQKDWLGQLLHVSSLDEPAEGFSIGLRTTQPSICAVGTCPLPYRPLLYLRIGCARQPAGSLDGMTRSRYQAALPHQWTGQNANSKKP